MKRLKWGDHVTLSVEVGRSSRASRSGIVVGRMREMPVMVYVAMPGRIQPDTWHESVLVRAPNPRRCHHPECDGWTYDKSKFCEDCR